MLYTQTSLLWSFSLWNSCVDLTFKVFFLQLASNTNALPVQLDSQGRVKYDALVKQGQRKDKVILRLLCKDFHYTAQAQSRFLWFVYMLFSYVQHISTTGARKVYFTFSWWSFQGNFDIVLDRDVKNRWKAELKQRISLFCGFLGTSTMFV